MSSARIFLCGVKPALRTPSHLMSSQLGFLCGGTPAHSENRERRPPTRVSYARRDTRSSVPLEGERKGLQQRLAYPKQHVLLKERSQLFSHPLKHVLVQDGSRLCRMSGRGRRVGHMSASGSFRARWRPHR